MLLQKLLLCSHVGGVVLVGKFQVSTASAGFAQPQSTAHVALAASVIHCMLINQGLLSVHIRG